jgi:capsular polysaccharide biosynthesis protein
MDVAENLGSRNTKLGFRVSVSAPGDAALPPFSFGATDLSGALLPLEPSNPEVLEAMTQPYSRSGVTFGEVAPGRGRGVKGYLDAVNEGAKVSSMDPRTWLAVLASECPRELFELIDAEGMEGSASAVARAVAELDMQPEWVDRFVVLAAGSLPAAKSEFTVVDVRRPLSSETLPTTSLMMPVFVNDGVRRRAVVGDKPIPAPRQEWFHIEDAVVQDGGTVLTEGELIAYEWAADPTLDFVAGQWDSVLGSRARESKALVRRRPVSKRRFDAAILLSGRNDNNWYHWLIEYLPRALQVDTSIPDGVPFVVSERTPQSGMDALSALSSREVVRLDSRLAHHFDTLHVLAPPVQILDTTQVPWALGLNMNTEPLRKARSIWVGDSAPAAAKRIFLRRKSAHRGLVNEAELVSIAHAHGLTIVDPGQLGWNEQVALFSTATLVVGASGAVMGNYLMMAEGSEVLAITSEPLHDFVLPAAIAHVNGVGFSYVLGAPTTKLHAHRNRNLWLHSDFTVSPRHFKVALREAIDRSR